MKIKMLGIWVLMISLFSFVSTNSFATILLTTDGSTNPSRVTLDTITVTPGAETIYPYSTYPSGDLLPGSYVATSSIGLFEGNDDGNISDGNATPIVSPYPDGTSVLYPDGTVMPVPPAPTGNNIGEYGDGLLNGEGGLFVDTAGNEYFTGLEFISQDDLQDINGDGLFSDPGWIHLANLQAADDEDKIETQHIDESRGWIEYSTSTSLDSSLSVYIGDLLEISFVFDDGSTDGISWEDTTSAMDVTSGTWTLTTKLDVIEQAQALLGDATFDHLAFSFKAGDYFAIYDFDFKEIFDGIDSPYLNFLTPYQLSGSFNLYDFPNPNFNNAQGISHINVWARDPSDGPTVVPEPSTFILLGAGLLGCGFYVRRKK